MNTPVETKNKVDVVEFERDGVTFRPFDVGGVPIQYRAILDVIEDQHAKAINGQIEGPTIPITLEQIKAKIKQLRRMTRNR
jgi:hypothetical protein